MEIQSCSNRYTCIYCKTTYLYNIINNDGSVSCQNCGRIFYPSGETELIPHKPLQFIKRRVMGTRIVCPNCKAIYLYREQDTVEGNLVDCQNCLEKIEFRGERIDTTTKEIIPNDENCLQQTILIVIALIVLTSIQIWIGG